jgi:hypothetical protein
MNKIYFHPESREELLAQEVAEALGDVEGFPYYLTVAQKYPESHIRRVLRHVCEVPAHRIRTSRGALFNWLVHHYGSTQQHQDNPSDARP